MTTGFLRALRESAEAVYAYMNGEASSDSPSDPSIQVLDGGNGQKVYRYTVRGDVNAGNTGKTDPTRFRPEVLRVNEADGNVESVND
jgi:hypothetical protein